MNYTAIIKQDNGWWIGWIEEIPGVNCQGKTREELRENLSSALAEAIEMIRADAPILPIPLETFALIVG